jgi:hypothetical protein
LVFALSDFLPVRHFALTFAVLLVAALVGDLVVLPALLVGPMGSWFSPRRRPTKSDAAAPLYVPAPQAAHAAVRPRRSQQRR